MTVGVIPVGIAVYALSRPDSENNEPYITRMISNATAGLHEKWTSQNDHHVRMIEQAGEDRVLFANTRPQEYVDMKFPEYVYPQCGMQPYRRRNYELE